MVYFMQAVDGGPIKIGYSADPEVRRKELENHYKRPLAILATMEGSRPEEKEVHARFSHLRFGKTEQFRPDPELMEFINAPLFACAGEVTAMQGFDPERVRSAVVNIRSRPEWKEWLEASAEAEGVAVADLIDNALLLLAREKGLGMPPKR